MARNLNKKTEKYHEKPKPDEPPEIHIRSFRIRSSHHASSLRDKYKRMIAVRQFLTLTTFLLLAIIFTLLQLSHINFGTTSEKITLFSVDFNVDVLMSILSLIAMVITLLLTFVFDTDSTTRLWYSARLFTKVKNECDLTLRKYENNQINDDELFIISERIENELNSVADEFSRELEHLKLR